MIDIILRATLTAAVAQGTPLLLTALGEIMNQRAGVLNLGLDGMMLFGAVTAFISLIASGSLFVAVLVGGVCAALLALIHAFLSITCRVHQVICGLALNIFAAGFSAFVGKDYNGIAAPKVLEYTGLTMDDMDVIELNEAFAAQYLACEKALGLDRSITNVNGSGISLGHPVGATGTRLITTLLYELRRCGGRYGLVSICAGGGMGVALVVDSQPQ